MEITIPFISGRRYKRKELHEKFGGQPQYGISTPSDNNMIFLFSGKSGKEHGYHDGWTDEGIYIYSGEGQYGDMTFTRGNKSIRDHLENGEELHLFKQVDTGVVEYIGQMIYIKHRIEDEDSRGIKRKTIVFELAPISHFPEESLEGEISEEELQRQSLDELRKKAMESSKQAVGIIQRIVNYRNRSRAIKEYALKRARGVCEACGQEAPFITEKGEPFLEVHHIHSLSDEGPDDPLYVAALCPNCHRQAHYGKDKKSLNNRIKSIVEEIELV